MWVKKQEWLELMTISRQLGTVLSAVSNLLERAGGKFIMNEVGSGDITYQIGRRYFNYNQFPVHFKGFTIYDKGTIKEVSLDEFIAEAFRGRLFV